MGLRASDADRERTVDFLRAQQAVGRLTVDELEERSAAAWAAVEVADLEALTADLPAQSPAPTPAPSPPAPARRLPRAAGRSGFIARWQTPLRSDKAMAQVVAELSPPLYASGYDLVERTAMRLVFSRRRTPAWVAFPIVLLFPIGLLALLVKTEDRIAIDLLENDEGTLLVAQGVAPLPVRRAFAVLEAD